MNVGSYLVESFLLFREREGSLEANWAPDTWSTCLLWKNWQNYQTGGDTNMGMRACVSSSPLQTAAMNMEEKNNKGTH